MITEEQIKNLTEDYKEYTKEELAFMQRNTTPHNKETFL